MGTRKLSKGQIPRLLFFTYNENDVHLHAVFYLLHASSTPSCLAWGKKKLGHPKNLAWATSLSQSARLPSHEALVITQLRFLVSCKLCKSCAFFSWHITLSLILVVHLFINTRVMVIYEYKLLFIHSTMKFIHSLLWGVNNFLNLEPILYNILMHFKLKDV